MLKNSDLGALLNAQAQPAVSVYLPLHPTNREIRQDSVRLRNLLQRAHGELLDQGLDAPMADALLKPAIDLIDDTGFWRDQDQGLALFIAPGEFHAHRLPVEPPEETVVGHQFHIR
ncbi:MAG TPA: hypothetical protein VEH84_00865, partial [Alphaproteobacteria bacterium]|nr:hypothetical protein [Alphaproteobacteria bacterium]